MPANKLTESQVQYRLYHKFLSGSQTQAPNYTPRGWWECDLWRVTESGYAYEYEIKLSVADFKADAKKAKRRYKQGLSVDEVKHDLLAADNERGPSYFYFVLPLGIVEDDDVPPWAGIIRFNAQWGWQAKVTRKAPQRHKKKARQATMDHAEKCLAYRYWQLRNGISLDMEKQT